MSPTARMPQQLRAAKRRLASISIKNDRPKFAAWPQKKYQSDPFTFFPSAKRQVSVSKQAHCAARVRGSGQHRGP
jgi:hypothetical protein